MRSPELQRLKISRKELVKKGEGEREGKGNERVERERKKEKERLGYV